MIVTKNRELGKQTFDKLSKHFKVKQLEGTSFLGMEIFRSNKSLIIRQKGYIDQILTRFRMNNATISGTPLADTKDIFENDDGEITKEQYREALGCLMYLANCTRPDIMFAVNLLSRFNQSPKQCHWIAVERIMWYLKKTISYSIEYQHES